MSEELRLLVEQARRLQVSPANVEAQRRSFAFGNLRLEDDQVTRAEIDRVAEVLEAEKIGRR